MTKAVKSSALLVAALWVGVLFCLGFIVAPYLFTLAARNPASTQRPIVAAESLVNRKRQLRQALRRRFCGQARPEPQPPVLPNVAAPRLAARRQPR